MDLFCQFDDEPNPISNNVDDVDDLLLPFSSPFFISDVIRTLCDHGEGTLTKGDNASRSVERETCAEIISTKK